MDKECEQTNHKKENENDNKYFKKVNFIHSLEI